jgi:SAM-dependent methyltransferase
VTLSTVTWKLRRARERLVTSRRGGLRGVPVEAARLMWEFARAPLALAAEYLFDVRRGVRTRGFVRNEHALSALSEGGDSNYYQPIGLSPLRRLVSTVPIEPGATTFVDLGAGRGRAVILAAELGFGRVLGIELDHDLAAEGAQNVGLWRVGRRGRVSGDQVVEVVEGDAAAFTAPGGAVLIALFNSFGATTLRLLLDRLCAGRRGDDAPLFLAYINPVHEDTFEEFPRLVPHSRAPGWTVYRLEPELASA